jgi:hypothetical protein
MVVRIFIRRSLHVRFLNPQPAVFFNNHLPSFQPVKALFPDGNCNPSDLKGQCRAQATAYQNTLLGRKCATRTVPML